MSTIQELEQKVKRLEQEIIRQGEATKALLTKSDKALDVAMNAYRIDHAGYVWVWDRELMHYRKTDVCVRVIIPKVRPKEITNCKIADKAVNNRTLDDHCVDHRVMACNAVGTRNLQNRSVTPCKVSPDFIPKLVLPLISRLEKRHVADIRKLLENDEELQHQIDSFNANGLSVSNRFGSDEYIGVSQKAITDAFNKLWEKIEDITGEILHGIDMTVTPEYYIGEDGCTVHITANTVACNGIFERIRFEKWDEHDTDWVLIGEEYENVSHVEFDVEFDCTTQIRCIAQIMGIEYKRESSVTHYSSFFLGSGTTYEDIMDVEHVIPVGHHMRGAYDIDVEDGDHIIIVVGERLAQGFIRADINGVEIAFEQEDVTIDDVNYKVFTSENTYSAGTINIDING